MRGGGATLWVALVVPACSLIYGDGAGPAGDDAGLIDAALGEADGDPGAADATPAGCEVVESQEALSFTSESMGSSPSGMTGLAVVDEQLFLFDVGAAGTGSPLIWVTKDLVTWGRADTLDPGDPGYVRTIDVGLQRIVDAFELSKVSDALAYAPQRGDDGSLCVPHESSSELPELKRRIACYDLATDTWGLVPQSADAPIHVTHGLSVVDNDLFGLIHAGDTSSLVRADLSGAPDPEFSHANPLGDAPRWTSRAAKMIAVGQSLVVMKNGYCAADDDSSACQEQHRIFRMAAADYEVGGATFSTDMAELPFDIGHGSTMVYLRPGWAGRVGAGGAVFITAGRAPSDAEGLANVADDRYWIYDIDCDYWHQGSLGMPSGSAASATMFSEKIVLKVGGDFDESNPNATVLWTDGF